MSKKDKIKSGHSWKDVTIFTALGIDTEGHKSILSVWVNEGDENKALWADVFQDMVTRGF